MHESFWQHTQIADSTLLALMQNSSHQRRIHIAQPGSDDLRYLDAIGAAGAVGGSDYLSITLRQDARKITVLEEFLHGTQAGLGIIERRGIGFAEIHVKRFMIRQPIRLHLHSGDLQALDILLEREIDRWRI